MKKIAVPKPKRTKKVKVEVRPYWISGLGNAIGILVDVSRPSDLTKWCGPVQTIEIEVDDD